MGTPRMDAFHQIANRYTQRDGNITTNLYTGNNSVSTSSVVGSIFGEVLGIGSTIAMAAMMKTGDNCLAGTGGGGKGGISVNDFVQARAVISTLTPKLQALQQRQLAATTNYVKEKSKLETDLKELNSKTEVGSSADTSIDPQAVKDLQAKRAELTKMQTAKTTYANTKTEMANMLKESPSGTSKPYLTKDGEANTFKVEDFTTSTDVNSEAYKAAESKVTTAKETAKTKESQYKTLQNNQIAIENQCKQIANANDPEDAISKLNTQIQGLENASAKKGDTADSPALTAKQYETQKAEIMKKLAQLESDKKGTALQTQIDNYETKIAAAQEVVEMYEAQQTANATAQKQIKLNNQDISDNKALMKENKKAGWKHFLGIRVGKKNTKDGAIARTAYNDYKTENKHLKAENKELS